MSTRDSNHRQRFWVRLVAIFLASLMIISFAYLAIMFIISASAAPFTPEELNSYAFKSSKPNKIYYVSVGIHYGTSVKVSHSITSPYGFVVGDMLLTPSEREFKPIYILYTTSVNAVCDANLTVGYQSCSLAASESATDIGGYHVELSLPDADIWDRLSDLSGLFAADYEHCFPAYNDNKRVVRVGSFASYSAASAAAAAIGAAIEGFNVSIASPSGSGVCFLNEDFDTILFEYSGPENHYGAIAAVQRPDTDYSYLCDSSRGYLYDGAFCFKRYVSGSVNGLTLINIVEMQEYIEGVLPSEIPNTWHLECQKAFAVTARAYTVANIGKHFSAYGFDLCASSDCQNYMGRRKVTQLVIDATRETANLALTYNGTLIPGYYSSSHGGYSVDTQYVWGGATGSYITSQPTPWEDYYSQSASGAMWQDEITPAQLATKFKNSGYSAIKGTSITSVSYELTGDSPYVYTLKGTDNKGNSATVVRCSKIRSLLSGYVSSANFVIGKGSVDLTFDKVVSTRIIDLTSSHAGNLYVHTASGNVLADSDKYNFFTALGQALRNVSNSLYITTAEGTALVSKDVEIPLSTTPDEKGYYTYVADYGTFLIVTQLQEVTQTYTASSSSNYVIAGRGKGHGVGMSQYGAMYLAIAGAQYNQILYAYYPGTTVVNIYDYWAGR